MAFISWGEVTGRIMLDPTSTIKYMGIYSSNPYAKTRYVTLGFAGNNCVGAEIASSSVRMPIKPTLPLETAAKLFEDLKNKFPESTMSFEGIESQSGVVPTAIKIQGLSQLRAIVQHLAKADMIKACDLEKVVPRVRQVEQHLALEKELVSVVTPKQSTIIAQEFEQEIDTLIAACQEADLNNLQLPPETTKRDLALSLFVDCMQRDLGTVLFEQLPTLKEKVYDSAKRLRDFYYGNSGLENKLTENCFTCPTLEKQREILFKRIEEKLDQTFGPAKPSFIAPANLQKVGESRAQLFTKGEILDMLRNGPYQVVLEQMFGTFWRAEAAKSSAR